MGGNATAFNKTTLEEFRADTIDIVLATRPLFREVINNIFFTLNDGFFNSTGKYIWDDISIFRNANVYNGSTSFIMSPDYTDDEIYLHKPNVGDVDISVPEELKSELWEYLDSIEGCSVLDNVIYAGSNKQTIQSIGARINSVFRCDFNGYVVNVQVDFEFLPYHDNKPSEWAKFAHSSDFSDVKLGIKSVNHKYLIRSIVGAASMSDDIVIALKKSTPENISLSKSVINTNPRMIKFSVDNGLRYAYKPMLHDGAQVIHEDKQVFLEIPTSESFFETRIDKIFSMTFKTDEVSEDDLVKFNSFTGVIHLCSKYLNEKEIHLTHLRYLELLWGHTYDRGQELVTDNPYADQLIKQAGYNYFIMSLGLENLSDLYISNYYSNYGQRKPLKYRGK